MGGPARPGGRSAGLVHLRMGSARQSLPLTLGFVRELGERFGGVSRQAISKTARQVAQRCQGHRGPERVLTKIEKQLRQKQKVATCPQSSWCDYRS